MTKKSIPTSNAFCPQQLFLYGTYKADGSANFGLFCWFSYYWDGDLHVMACLGGGKLTKDRIRETGVFSANLVTESLLPLADRCGNQEGYTSEKSPENVQRGEKLNVPILSDSPWSFELEVERTIDTDDGMILLCAVRNTLVDERLVDDTMSVEDRMALVRPALYVGAQRYFGLNPKPLGACGQWKDA